MLIDPRITRANDIVQVPRGQGKDRSAVTTINRMADAINGVFCEENCLIYVSRNFLSSEMF